MTRNERPRRSAWTFLLALVVALLTIAGSGLADTGTWRAPLPGPIPSPAPWSPDLARGSPKSPHTAFAHGVNVVFGRFVAQHQDVTLPGSPHLGVTRTYNTAAATQDGPLGFGWVHSFTVEVMKESTSTVVLRNEDGRLDRYRITSFGNSIPPPGIYDRLVRNSDGTYTVTRRDRTRYDFDSAGQLQTIQDRNGNTTRFTYDADGRLVGARDAVGRDVLLIYDQNNDRIASISDPLGREVRYSYDAAGDLVSVTDPLGNVTRYTYDANHRITGIAGPGTNEAIINAYGVDGTVVEQRDALGNSTRFTYDVGRTTVLDRRGNATAYDYETNLHRITAVTDALGNSVRYEYDARNNRTAVTDQNAHTTRFEYDTRGNLTRLADAAGGVASYTYDQQSNMLTGTDPLRRTTRYEYDARGNVTAIVDPAGGRATLAYDGTGQLVETTDAAGRLMRYTYDAGRNLSSATDPLGNRASYAYDAVGRLTEATDAKGTTTRYAYDALDRLIEVRNPTTLESAFRYDASGNTTHATDANGVTATYSYDALNRLVSSTDGMGGTTAYDYDSVGNVIGVTDPASRTTRYEYDATNRLTRETNPLGLATTYQYDPAGNLVSRTDPKRQTTTYTYDPLNRVTAAAYPDLVVEYAYDPVGNRTRMVDAAGTTDYTYDALDSVISIDRSGATVRYSYDAVGNTLSTTYPDGRAVTYAYDGAGRLATVTDWSGRTTEYTYDPVGNVIRIRGGNRVVTAQGYNEHREPLSISYRGRTSRPFARFTYSYDALGNQTSMTDIDGLTSTYQYDARRRMHTYKWNRSENIAYDSVGNPVTRTVDGAVTRYTYDAGDRLLEAAGPDGTTTFAYDANGNLVQRTAPDGTATTYDWDGADRLVRVTTPTLTTSYEYDGDGNRVRTSSGGVQRSYFWASLTDIPTALVRSGPEGDTNYVYGRGLISSEGGGSLQFYHHDGRGSIIATTNANADVTKRFSYDPWGVPTGSFDFDTGDHGFTRQLWDEATGLLYLRSRYYDPELGRFISRKTPPLLQVTSSTERNGYAYALDNPTTLVSPDGRSSLRLECLLDGGPGVTGTSSLMATHDPVSGRGLLSYGSRGLGSGGFPGCIFLGGVMDIPTFSEPHPYTMLGSRTSNGPVVAHYGYGWGLEGGSGRYGWTAVVQLGSIRREIQTSPAGDAGRTLFVWDSPSDLGRLGHVVPQKIPLGFGPPSVAAPAPAELVIPHQGRL